MKKLYTCFTLLLSVIAFSFNTTHAGTQGIFITSVENDTVCANGYIGVVYYCSGFTPTGTLSVELSNAAGSFASPVVIATVAAAPSGTIYANIPSNTTAGNGYRVRITSSTPAFTGAPNAVDIRVNPKPQPVITTLGGDIAYCQGGCAPLLVNDDPSFVAYYWFLNGIQFSNSSMIQNNSCINGDCFTALVIDTNGCEGVSNTLCITVYQNPEPEITTNDPIEFCDEDDITFNATPGYEYYDWLIGGGSMGLPGIESFTSNLPYNDCYSVEVTDTNGCTGISNEICVTVHPTPEPVLIADGVPSLCEGDTVMLCVQGAYSSILWTTGSANVQCISVYQPTCVQAYVEDQNGCAGISDTVCINIHYSPNAHIYTNSDTICEGNCTKLIASDDPIGIFSFLWSNGSTDQAIIVCDSGSYSLTVTEHPNGCLGYDTITIYSTSDTADCPLSIDEASLNNFNLYPNPATTTLTIESTVNSPQTTVAIHNAQGQLVSHPLSRGECASLSAGKGCVVDISSFAPGIYFLTLSNEEQTLSRKFVKE